VPETDADDAAATVSLSIFASEGKQFRLGTLLLGGQEPNAGDGPDSQETWKPMQAMSMTAASLSNGGNLQRRRFHASSPGAIIGIAARPRIGHRERPTQISRR
jgi:hypothetical protein